MSFIHTGLDHDKYFSPTKKVNSSVDTRAAPGVYYPGSKKQEEKKGTPMPQMTQDPTPQQTVSQPSSQPSKAFGVSPMKPVATSRYGYAGTGLCFTLARCISKTAFAEFTAKRKLEKFTDPENTVPASMCYATGGPILPNTGIAEARNGYLCEIVLVVLAIKPEQRRQELRHWRHEIGHAADFAGNVIAGIAPGLPVSAMKEAAAELRAYVTEFLCEAVDLCFDPNTTTPTPESGIPHLIREISALEIATAANTPTVGA